LVPGTGRGRTRSSLDGRAAVIRLGDHVEDFRKDHAMAVHSCAALPVPAVIEIGAVGDGYFAVSSARLASCSMAWTARGCAPRCPACWLDALRAIDVSGTEGYGIWVSNGPPCPRL
jgi:hypothetical protein